MQLGQLNQSLYPRAINPSTEGNKRQDGQEREIRPGVAASTKRPQSAPGRGDARIHRDDRERHYQHEQKLRRESARQEQEYSDFTSRAASYGEQLAQASRQARHMHQRRSYSPPALVSAKGREANRRYLETGQASQARFIDEVI